jgi:lipopolysaccharide/colanic/teichoic acid biosynthesis glycosyltransferase
MPVYTLETFYEKYWRKIPVTALESSWPLRMGFQLVSQSPYAHAKRLFDLVVSGLALVFLSPLMALLAALTVLDSGRPAMFLQSRVGLGNKPFTILKFRTMHARPVESAADLYTVEGDPRITRLGYWLRKLRLDELPQLWNVFKGDMTLIGPRAEWTKCVELYNGKIPFYHLRHLVKPGITGWAQINYPYGQNAEDALQKLTYDLYYIRHYSLRLDAMIVLKTLHVMLWGKGQ